MVSGDDVESAIAVHIAQSNETWLSSSGEVYFGFKGAIAIAQKNAGSVGIIIRNDDIEFTVAVYIAQGHETWFSTRGEGGLRLKGAIAIA